MKSNIQALFKAIRRGSVRGVHKCIVHGVNIETRLGNGQTPLLYAIAHKKIYIASFLLMRNANIEARDNKERTALLLAVEKNMPSMVECLLDRGADVDARKYCYEGPYEGTGACDPRHWSDSALIIAAKHNNYPMVCLLLEHGADVSLCEECEGGTALHYAADPHIVQLLIDHGADVNAGAGVDGRGQTALMRAAGSHHYEKAKVLIYNGADMNAFNSIDGTAAHTAAEFGCMSILKFLLDASFDVHSVTPQSMSLLWHGRHMLSAKGGEKYLRFLLKYGYDINMKYGGATDFLRMGHDSALHVVKLLVYYGADVHAVDDKGKTVFGHITRHSRAENLQYLFSLGIAKTQADEESLFSCVEYDLLDALQVFMENGANANAVNAEGCSLLEYAKRLEREDMCAYLQTVLNVESMEGNAHA